MAWLSGWDNRIKLTIDHDKVDAALTWFPVTVFLDSTHGDCVFDELTADGNRFKIALTKADGTTELYGEIEKWEDVNEIAVIHVSKDGWIIANGEDTDFYLYYDAAHADNTTYIGDINSTPGAAVWDNDFRLVCHMVDATTSTVKDSTSDNNDGTKKGAAEPFEVNLSLIGMSQAFDGSNDYISCGAGDGSLDITGDKITLEAVAYHSSVDDAKGWILGKMGSSAGSYSLFFGSVSAPSSRVVAFGLDADLGWTDLAGDTANAKDTWYYLCGSYDGTDKIVYRNGASDGTVGETGNITSRGNPLRLGHEDGWNSQWFNGMADEVRISDDCRLAAWIKATYNSLWNTLLTYGSEEVGGAVAPTSVFYGPLHGPFTGPI